MSNQSASEICNRFRSEMDNISEYVGVIDRMSRLSDHQTRSLNLVLVEYDLPPIKVRARNRLGDPFTQDELKRLSDSVKATLPALTKVIAEYEEKWGFEMESTPMLPYELETSIHEWVGYFSDALPWGTSEEEKTLLIDSTLQQRGWENSDSDEDNGDADFEKCLMGTAIEEVERLRLVERFTVLHSTKEDLERLRFSVRLREHDEVIHLLRQGFILLMTVFDAAVFDLTRVALNRDFFGLIGKFSKQPKHESVSINSIVEYGSFDVFQQRVIEEHLKKLYVKDLIGLLTKEGVDVISASGTDQHIDLYELILRRNVHVHNRGIVDDRYLERDDQNKPKYNKFDLKVGCVAEITIDYWTSALRLCSGAIDAIAQWADGIPMNNAPVDKPPVPE